MRLFKRICISSFFVIMFAMVAVLLGNNFETKNNPKGVASARAVFTTTHGWSVDINTGETSGVLPINNWQDTVASVSENVITYDYGYYVGLNKDYHVHNSSTCGMEPRTQNEIESAIAHGCAEKFYVNQYNNSGFDIQTIGSLVSTVNQITLIDNISGSTNEAVQSVQSGEQVILSTPFARAGYKIVSWNTNSDGSGTNYETNVATTFSEDVTLYAQWTLANYAIFYYDAGDSNFIPYSGNAIGESYKSYQMSAEVFVLPTLIKAGYAGHWVTTPNGNTIVTEIPANSAGDMFFYAKWEQLFSITTTASSNGTITETETEIDPGETRTVVVTPNAGCFVWEIKVDGVSIPLVSSESLTIENGVYSYTFESISENHTIVANFDTKAYNYEFSLSSSVWHVLAHGSTDSHTYEIVGAVNAISSFMEAIELDRRQGTEGSYTYADCTIAFPSANQISNINIPLKNGKYSITDAKLVDCRLIIHDGVEVWISGGTYTSTGSGSGNMLAAKTSNSTSKVVITGDTYMRSDASVLLNITNSHVYVVGTVETKPTLSAANQIFALQSSTLYCRNANLVNTYIFGTPNSWYKNDIEIESCTCSENELGNEIESYTIWFEGISHYDTVMNREFVQNTIGRFTNAKIVLKGNVDFGSNKSIYLYQSSYFHYIPVDEQTFEQTYQLTLNDGYAKGALVVKDGAELIDNFTISDYPRVRVVSTEHDIVASSATGFSIQGIEDATNSGSVSNYFFINVSESAFYSYNYSTRESTYFNNDTNKLVLPTLTGYTFGGYYVEGEAEQRILIIDAQGQLILNIPGYTDGIGWICVERDLDLYPVFTSSTTITLDGQGATVGTFTSSVTATYNNVMPTIDDAPQRQNMEFVGYYSEANGLGVKYYNADLSSARVWNIESPTFTLYAHYIDRLEIYVTADAVGGNGTQSSPYGNIETAMDAIGNVSYASGYGPTLLISGVVYYKEEEIFAISFSISPSLKLTIKKNPVAESATLFIPGDINVSSLASLYLEDITVSGRSGQYIIYASFNSTLSIKNVIFIGRVPGQGAIQLGGKLASPIVIDGMTVNRDNYGSVYALYDDTQGQIDKNTLHISGLIDANNMCFRIAQAAIVPNGKTISTPTNSTVAFNVDTISDEMWQDGNVLLYNCGNLQDATMFYNVWNHRNVFALMIEPVVEGENVTYNLVVRKKANVSFNLNYETSETLNNKSVINSYKYNKVLTIQKDSLTKYEAENVLLVTPTARTGWNFLGWSLTENGELLTTDSVVELTADQKISEDETTIVLYAKWEVSIDIYTIEHWFEKLDGTFEKMGSKTQSLSGQTGTVSETATYLSADNLPAGFEADLDNENKVVSGVILADGSLTLKLYYTRVLLTVTWNNYDGSLIKTDASTKYGATPVYNGTTPTKPSSEQYTYVFSGWTPELSSLTANTIYTAVFNVVSIETGKIDPENSKDEVEGFIEFEDNSVEEGVEFVVKVIDEKNIDDRITPPKNQEIVKSFNAQLLKNNVEVTDYNGVMTIKIAVPEEIGNRKNVAVVIIDKDTGAVVTKTATVKDGYLIFETNSLGDFAIVADKEQNNWWIWLLIGGLLIVTGLLFLFFVLRRHVIFIVDDEEKARCKFRFNQIITTPTFLSGYIWFKDKELSQPFTQEKMKWFNKKAYGKQIVSNSKPEKETFVEKEIKTKGHFAVKMKLGSLSKRYVDRLNTLTEQQKNAYIEIKNELLSYDALCNSLTKDGDTFKFKNDTKVKLSVLHNQLRFFVDMDDDMIDGRFKRYDSSKFKKYTSVPLEFTIDRPVEIRKAKNTISRLVKSLQIEKTNQMDLTFRQLTIQ